MDLPPELILMILSYLRKDDLKRARRVSRKLASLGAQRLIQRLYISPRTKDMDVFDAVTQHPELRKSVKHLVYDTAHFVHYDIHDYFDQLCMQLNRTRYRYWRKFHPAVKDLIGVINGIQVYGYDGKQVNGGGRKAQGSAAGFQRCQAKYAFAQGFWQYTQLAREQDNILSVFWLTKACKGLDCLGQIDSVTIDTEWRTNLVKIPADRIETDIDQRVNNFGPDDPSDDENDETDEDSDDHVWFNPAGIMDILGKPLKGSPVARAWPPTSLLPTIPIFRHPYKDASPLLDEGIENGSFAFFRVIQLLRMTGKQPTHIATPREWYDTSGIPPYVFDPNRPFSTDLSCLQTKLRVLQLQIAGYQGGGTKRLYPHLHHLQTFLANAPALEQLELALPHDLETIDEDEGSLLYHFDQVFPSLPDWRLTSLCELEFGTVSGSYRQFVALFFLNIPKLKSLTMASVQLTDGRWEDIIEGLAKLISLGKCSLNQSLLYPGSRLYSCNGSDEFNWKEHDNFMDALSCYIVSGGRHPSLPAGAPDSTSTAYLERLNFTLSELRTAPGR
ncbi:MAG: hypothetical protein Q9181_005496 [Wetmoreana brouardii]